MEQKREEIEKAETGQIGEGLEFKEEDRWKKKLSMEKSKSTREGERERGRERRRRATGTRSAVIISFLRLRYVRRDDEVQSGSIFYKRKYLSTQ
ncbi:hypothetical protein Csa_004958 [Cucumis sativus]|uniref:Uncharacterized protein n=1 Tax=Cucumis sativus TaxID=3659 RepID=A0A0A0KBS8_CUCSA|nr:hypothetical protein Csa_004958 [Cucumis sativus]